MFGLLIITIPRPYTSSPTALDDHKTMWDTVTTQNTNIPFTQMMRRLPKNFRIFRKLAGNRGRQSTTPLEHAAA